MVPRADRHAFLIDDRADVVRLHTSITNESTLAFSGAARRGRSYISTSMSLSVTRTP